MNIPSFLGAWVVLVAWTWIIKVIIFHDSFFVLHLTVFFYFVTKLGEYNKKYQNLLAENAISKPLNSTKTAEIRDKTSSSSQTATYLTSYFMSQSAPDSKLFQTLNESFMKYYRRKHRYIRGLIKFQPTLSTIVEVMETVKEYLGPLPYPPPSQAFLEKHRRKHIRRRNEFRFIPILGTIQEVSHDSLAMETGV
ncbi:hypothetical protein NPIL_359561 [Nephila pilipes]|uniref:Uncharacterized protein n=1 Tax=Nephila pilipes TaxID=299642 RepID=A0A8X6T8V2_NEPPI|nr:hypothetical protein NPIL_359561 [Nephila pilipes]